jgi:isopentenyl-diphosphate delta-isomerase
MMPAIHNLTVVDKKSNIIGYEEKEKCHDGGGILHSAFSIFIFNDKKQLLIQQRSKYKRLWPLHWSNSCCSHPRAKETLKAAAERRLREELGFSCNLKYLYKFRYFARYKHFGSENEICSVLIGKSNNGIILNPREIADCKWVNITELINEIHQNPDKFTPWFKIEIKDILSYHQEAIKNL